MSNAETGRFSSGSNHQEAPKRNDARHMAARDAVYGAAMAAFRLPQDAPCVDELIGEIQRAHVDTIAAAEKRNAEGLTNGQYLAVEDLVYFGEGEMFVAGTVFELTRSDGFKNDSITMKDYPPINDWRTAVIRFPMRVSNDFAALVEQPSYSLRHQRGKSLVRVVRVYLPSPHVDACEVTVRNLRFKETV